MSYFIHSFYCIFLFICGLWYLIEKFKKNPIIINKNIIKKNLNIGFWMSLMLMVMKFFPKKKKNFLDNCLYMVFIFIKN